MNKVLFPELNLELNVPQVALEIGNAKIYWYAIAIVFGIILSLILMYFSKKKYDIKYDDLLEIFIYIIITGVLGARLFYVVFNLEYYLENIEQIFNIQNGGLAIFGGIIFGAITAGIACKIKKIDFLNFCDYVVPYLALSQSIGRIGNFFNVEAYGIETKNFFRMGIETVNGYIEVHPCFLYEMIGCFAIFVVLKILQMKQTYKGEILSFYFIFYGILRFLIEGVRADSLMFFSIKISQFIAITIAILGFAIYIKNSDCRNLSMKK